MAQLRRMWSGRPEDAAHRSAVLRAMRAQSMEFSELNVEYGYCYQSAAVVPDGSAAPAPADEIRVYQPSTRPGAPLPHAWIEDEDGRRRPVKDLIAPGRFLLTTAARSAPKRASVSAAKGSRAERRYG
jgi:2,4-dichlorophenol 6-monooxygenase